MSDRYVYAVEHPDGFFKLGVSKNPYNRVSQINVGSPYDLEFRYALKCFPSNFREDAEPVVHKELEEFNVGGEWFKTDSSTILRAFHEILEDDDVEGYTIYDIKRRREEECRFKRRHERLNRRPRL